MPYEIIVAGAMAIIAILLLLIKTNGAVVFFSLCAGSVLANQLGGEASLLLTSFIKDGDLSRAVTAIGMILLPAIFSALFLRGSITASKMFFNILPSAAVGALTVLLVVPFIPGGLREQLMNNAAWDMLERFESVVILSGILSGVLLLWLSQNKHKKDKKHKK